MSQIIPGGRPRASSDGDILDEGFCGTFFTNLSDRHNEAYRKNPGKALDVNINNSNTSSRNHLDLSNDAFDSDGEISSQSQSSSVRSRRQRFSFKSMRKAVSRAFVNNSKPNEPAVRKGEKISRATGDLTKVWTPDLRHIGEGFYGKKGGHDNGIMSSARPLITDPGMSMNMMVPKWKKTPGTVGIYNHGNSCFMNAVLQCLSSTDSFTEYFVRDFFKTDLKNSKLGKKGMFRSNHGLVTEQLGQLLKSLWCGKYTSDVSKEFKAVVGSHNRQYTGDHQHDAQEFLLWLLNCVHREVSTYSKKKSKSPKIKTDEELASEAASVNGESFVIKLFQALQCSTLTCPTCGKHSSTFDPYLCVSLPLPQRCPRVLYVILVSLESHHYHEVKMAVTLNQFEGVRDLRTCVSLESKIPSKQLLLAQLRDDGFGATYSDEQPLSDIPENEIIYAIETYSNDASMHTSAQEFDTPTAQVLVIHIETPGGSSHSYRFGSPAVLRVRRDITWKSLQREILLKMDDAVCQEIFSRKLSPLFSLRIYDGSSMKNSLPPDVDMPLYTQSAESAYNSLDEDFGPPHIKIIAEWDSQIKKTVVVDDKEHVEIHPSVKEVQNNPPGQGKVSLDECFKLYTQEEKLIGDDAWLCPYCKQQPQGTIKSLGLWSLPDILVLHLKRFKQIDQRRSKLNTLVDFPIDNLDMSGHLTHRPGQNGTTNKDDHMYDLLGVSNHYGSMMGGHYTAFCRSPVDGEWREFNDTKVRILEGAIATKEAYLLFYQRRSLSKDVNQRLFTGDHWVFSLNLALSEIATEDNSMSDETAPKGESESHRPKRSRSRSASPSAHRQSNKEGTGLTTRRAIPRPLTPQPTRRPIISYTERDVDDDSRPTSPNSSSKSSPTRKSRPVQRQVSEPGSQFRREKSAGAISTLPRNKDPLRSLYDRRSFEEDEQRDFLEGKKTTYKSELSNGIESSQISSRLRGLEKEKPPLDIRHTSSRNNDLSVSTSRTISHQSRLHSDSLGSDAKYPSPFEPSSHLRVRLERENPPFSSSLPPVGPTENESARKKLAQLAKQQSMEKALAQRQHSIDTIEEETHIVQASSRYESQRSYDPSNRNLDIDYLIDFDNPHSSNNGHTSRFDYFPTDSRGIDYPGSSKSNRSEKEFSRRKHAYVRINDVHQDSLLEEQQPDLRTKFDQRFVSLAEQHFGPSDRLGTYNKYKYKDRYEMFADDTGFRETAVYGQQEEKFRLLNGERLPSSKYATIGRFQDTPEPGRLERDAIPRSSTDHNIQYTSLGVAPPPSPTPPHSMREQQTFSHTTAPLSLPSSTSDYFSNNHMISRDTSINSFHFTDRRFSDQDTSLPSATARPGPAYASGNRERLRFHPPRRTFHIKPKSTRSLGNIPTPCLRESSV